jgi:hypothetical protein
MSGGAAVLGQHRRHHVGQLRGGGHRFAETNNQGGEGG